MRTVLITGAYGFVGRHAARIFKDAGYHVVGIGNGNWAPEESLAAGVDEWLDSVVTVDALLSTARTYDLVVHCAGNGSVFFSVTNPMQDFQKTVTSTAAVLEFLRLKSPRARLIYLSSAAVYGAQPDAPIHEDASLHPVSPYGHTKKISEELCAMYRDNFGLDVTVIRFYSIYGNGLKKQILWDACNRLGNAGGEPHVFHGTGDETRDFIHVDDAARLILAVAQYQGPKRDLLVLNGGSGKKVAIRNLLGLVSEEVGSGLPPRFNGTSRPGDPCYYHADVSKAAGIGWQAEVVFTKGVKDYVQWFQRQRQS